MRTIKIIFFKLSTKIETEKPEYKCLAEFSPHPRAKQKLWGGQIV